MRVTARKHDNTTFAGIVRLVMTDADGYETYIVEEEDGDLGPDEIGHLHLIGQLDILVSA